ncbi:hypothetical protein SAMN02745126_04692 [Enhydrobacter aerosaccus]|uniref:PemK-like, MazF-like toxin of type II toxin-antitoxin system n=1 Tax=Enhydrobacter aerosaccus TaxID=225324 RepID=A0A1T4SHS9_9HYPH|nr:hypothetical protein [Enhydrobacter aerosaccus]SKA27706.1 hypothetical protein SAMN02745126_04692 [Enhydrobacter aerosaccus]
MFQPGDVLDFNYLWHRQAEAGEETGRKVRPVCVLLAISRDPSRLYLFPLTTQQPSADRAAIAVPEIERRRTGLDAPSWIIVDEFNLTNTHSLYDFAGLTARGSFGTVFTRKVAAEALARLKRGRVNIVQRS